MINIIAIIVVLVIIGIIRGLVESRREAEESPLDQRIRINEMKMTKTANERRASEIAARVMKEERGDKNKNISMNRNLDESENMAERNGDKTEGSIVSPERWDTLKLMESVLKDLGCQPKKESEKELQVAYQGENFVINIGGPYAQIWDPGWANINVNDPNFENLKTAANISNFDFGPSIVWSEPTEEGFVYIHSKRDILLCPELKDITSYMRSVMDSFFEKKERMRGQFHALINQQQQSPKSHRPVGFATSEDDEKN